MILTPSTEEQEVLEDLNISPDITEELTEILEQAYGVGRVKVMLTIETTEESIYATDKQETYNETEREVTQQIILASGGGVEQPIKLYEISPKYKGALIVCDGADSPSVKLEIISAVSSLCGISSDKITILKMKE